MQILEKKLHVFGLKSDQTPVALRNKGSLKYRSVFRLSMPDNPSNNLLLDHIDGIEFFLIFWVLI